MFGGYSIGSATLGGYRDSKVDIALGVAEATALALNFSQRTDLELGIAGSTASALPFEMKVSLHLGLAESTAKALPGEATAKGTVLLNAGIALSTASAMNANAIAKGTVSVNLGVVDVRAEALPFDIKVFLPVGVANATATGLNAVAQAVGKLILELGIASATANAFDAEILYLVRGVPRIHVTRDETDITIEILNGDEQDVDREVIVYKSDNVAGAYTKLVKTLGDVIVDADITVHKNYRYKAAFAVTGNTGGVEVVSIGQRSLSKYAQKRTV